MTDVPFLDLKAEYQALKQAIDAAVASVLDKCDFILGSAVGAFEEDFARYCGARFAVGVNSGLDALTLALEACGIGPGDEVITAANTFIATACSISQSGATPVLVDCDEDTMALDADRVEEAITPRTRAIVPVHLYGRLVDWEPLQDVADRHGLLLFEDAAQAHGASWEGRRAGTFGKAGSFSFYPSKNLGAFGDGGCVVTDDEKLAEYVRHVRTYGQRVKNCHDWLGTNSRLDTVQAAVLRVKLQHLDNWNRKRRAAADYYRRLLADLPVQIPAVPRGELDHVYHLFVVRVPQRDQVQTALAAAGVQTGIHYPTPIHLQPAYQSLGKPHGSFPVAERGAGEILSLPMFPLITRGQIEYVVDTLGRVLKKLGIHEVLVA
jgi:dTDP-4-amino-4,6-dideoxygalactose transaminase